MPSPRYVAWVAALLAALGPSSAAAGPGGAAAGPGGAAGGQGRGAPATRASDAYAPEVSELSSDVVFAASKRLQQTQEAPAIVRVFTREQIERGGFRNLNQLLASIPEVELVDTGRYQYLLIKGAPKTVLVLLDGVSLVNHFDNHVDLERLVPLEIVRKVEVVLSPGGVLWGAHSVYGVVNVITRQRVDQRQQRVSISGGWWKTLRGSYSLASSWSDLRWQAHLSVETYTSETVQVEDSLFVPPATFGNAGETGSDTGLSLNAFGSLRWRGWFVRALAQLLDEHPYAIAEGTGARARPGENSLIEIPTLSVSAGHERTVRWSKLRLRFAGLAYLYDQVYRDEAYPYPKSTLLAEGEVAISRIDRQLRVGVTGEAQARYDPSTTTLGFDVFRGSASVFQTYNRFEGGEATYVALPAVSSVAASFYAQQELQLLRDINLAVGARVNLSGSYSTALLLHGHVVYEPLDGFWVKANYSEGFRPPSFEQRFIDAPFQKGDDGLKPEQSRVVEAQASYLALPWSRVRLEAGAGYTYARFSNLIGAVREDMLWVFSNLRAEQIHSVSLFTRAKIERLLALNAHAALHFPAASDGADKREDFARVRVAVDATLLRFDPLTITVRYGFTGPRRLLGYLDPVQKVPVDIDIDAYHELSLALRLKLYRTPLYLSLIAKNLLFDDHDHIPPYTHDENIYRAPFPQPDTAYGFVSLQWIHDL